MNRTSPMVLGVALLFLAATPAPQEGTPPIEKKEIEKAGEDLPLNRPMSETEKRHLDELLKKIEKRVKEMKGVSATIAWSTYRPYAEGEEYVAGTGIVVLEDGKIAKALYRLGNDKIVSRDKTSLHVCCPPKKTAERYVDAATFGEFPWRIGLPFFLKTEIEKDFEIRSFDLSGGVAEELPKLPDDPNGDKGVLGLKTVKEGPTIAPNDRIAPPERRAEPPAPTPTANYVTLTMFPKSENAKKAYRHIEAVVDRDTGCVATMTLTGARGTTQVVSFAEFKKRENVGDGEVTVDLTGYTVTSK